MYMYIFMFIYDYMYIYAHTFTYTYTYTYTYTLLNKHTRTHACAVRGAVAGARETERGRGGWHIVQPCLIHWGRVIQVSIISCVHSIYKWGLILMYMMSNIVQPCLIRAHLWPADQISRKSSCCAALEGQIDAISQQIDVIYHRVSDKRSKSHENLSSDALQDQINALFE